MSPELFNIIGQYCEKYPDQESGGIVRNDDTFTPLPNLSKNKRDFYETLISDYNFKYLVHSHLGLPVPSEIDKIVSNKLSKPSIIYSLKTKTCEVFFPSPNFKIGYIGRPYLLGITDCLQLVADYYLNELNISITEIKPEIRWLHQEPKNIADPKINSPENLSLLNHFLDNGFQIVPKTSIKIYDVVLKRSKLIKCAHSCGVYLGNQRILEHYFQKASDTYPLNIKTDADILFVLRHTSV